MPRSPDELRGLVEEYLDELELWPHLHGQAESVRYSITVGGKRVRPVIVLATAEAAGVEPDAALPAGCALELVHTFSLVHDDLPGARQRRGAARTGRRRGSSTARRSGSSPATRCSPRRSASRRRTTRRTSRASSRRRRSA